MCALIKVTCEFLLMGVVNMRNVRSTPGCTVPMSIRKYSGRGIGGNKLMLFSTRREKPSATELSTPRMSLWNSYTLVCLLTSDIL